MVSLNEYFISKNINITEGHTGSNELQQKDIIEILRNNNFQKIMEIGFNAGHSAELFLNHSNAYVYSFDIGDHFHQYLKYGKKYINNKYPDRHTIVFGNSLESVPRFKNNNNITFDLVFIDGGHDYEIAYADLINCRNLSNKDTIVIMDDIVKNPAYVVNYTIGPSMAWNKLIELNMMKEISHSDYSKGRGQSVGKFIYN